MSCLEAFILTSKEYNDVSRINSQKVTWPLPIMKLYIDTSNAHLLLLGKAECALNCRPRGLSFYATLNKTVIDGTPCHHPVAYTGKAAPKGTRGVCIDGYCKVGTFIYRNYYSLKCYNKIKRQI